MKNRLLICAEIAVAVSLSVAANAAGKTGKKPELHTSAHKKTKSNAPVSDKLSKPLKQTIVVTGVYKPTPLSEADRSITVIPVKGQTLLTGALVDALREDASVDLEERGPDGTQADVSILGGTFEQTLVLIDGWRVNDVESGHLSMDLPISMNAVSSIQVLHGSGSTLYGSDAVGGVVNFVTKTPSETELDLRSAFGNFGINQQDASLDYVHRHLSEALDFSRDFSTGFMPDRDYRNLTLDSITDFKTHLGMTHVLLGSNDRPYGANDFYGNFDSWEHTRTWFAGVRQDLGKHDQVSFAFRRHTDEFVLFRYRPWIYTNHHAVESSQAAWQHDKRLSTNSDLFAGIDGYYDTIHSNLLGIHQRTRGAVYAAWNERALRRFSFTLGAREEIYNGLHGEFSPSVSGGYWLTDNMDWRASVARAFRLPTFVDLYYHDPANSGNPNLKPETAWSEDAGFDWRLRPRVAAHLTFFERQENNGIDYVRTTANGIWTAENIDRLNFRGIELAADKRFHSSQRVELSDTYLHGSKAPLGIVQSQYLFNYLINCAQVTWLGALPGGFIARTELGVLSRIHQETYALWSASIARSRGRVHPFIQVSNLTNTSYEEIAGVPMPGRTFVAGIDFLIFSRN